jgi:hypothetical protein
MLITATPVGRTGRCTRPARRTPGSARIRHKYPVLRRTGSATSATAEEQRSALAAYERGTAALDAATRVKDMGAVSRAIAEGQYHLACADGQPRPERRPSCLFDPRHGMSVRDVYWTPSGGGAGRTVPACSACAHKTDAGVEPEMRNVEVNGAPVRYVNAGFAPAYWGGFGFGPGLFTGFLLGQAFAPRLLRPPAGITAAGTSAAKGP